MLVEAGLMIVLGVVAVLVPGYAPFRRYLARSLAGHAQAQLPQDRLDAVEARAARRARAVGVGVVLAGITVAVLHAVAGRGIAGHGGWLPIGLLYALAAAALAVVEIWRPRAPDGSTRTARASVPTLTDYLPAYISALTWTIAGAGLASAAATMALTRSRWFDGPTVLASEVPVIAVALVVLAALTHLAVARVLGTPQPARDEADLYWQDVVRASTLSSLHVPLALVGLLTTWVAARGADAAASAVAVDSGQVGPYWTGVVLVGGYVLVPLLVLSALAVVLVHGRDNERTRFRRRLWSAEGPHAVGSEA